MVGEESLLLSCLLFFLYSRSRFLYARSSVDSGANKSRWDQVVFPGNNLPLVADVASFILLFSLPPPSPLFSFAKERVQQ
jgi:hypothetical protein